MGAQQKRQRSAAKSAEAQPDAPDTEFDSELEPWSKQAERQFSLLPRSEQAGPCVVTEVQCFCIWLSTSAGLKERSSLI